MAEPLTLVCPAQGSPVPGYRSALPQTSHLHLSWVVQYMYSISVKAVEGPLPLALNILKQTACLPSSSVICVTKILNFEKKLCFPVCQLKGIPSGQSAFQTTLYYRTCWWISSKVFGKKFRICFDRKIFASLQSGLSCAGFSYSSI